MEKIKEIINKILGKPSGSDSSDSSSSSSSGFTLIELLIVIAVIGILAAALLVAIDPIDKVNAGNDSKVLNDIRSIHDAALREYTNTNALPATVAGLDDGELKTVPQPPNNYADDGSGDYVYVVNGTDDDVYVCGEVKSKANRDKADPASRPATAHVYISEGQVCFNDGACPGTYQQAGANGANCQ